MPRRGPTLTLCPSRAWLAGRCMTSPKTSWPRRPIPWMGELAEVKPEWSSIVELRFFLGLTDEETAEVMGLVCGPCSASGRTRVAGCLRSWGPREAVQPGTRRAGDDPARARPRHSGCGERRLPARRVRWRSSIDGGDSGACPVGRAHGRLSSRAAGPQSRAGHPFTAEQLVFLTFTCGIEMPNGTLVPKRRGLSRRQVR